MNLNQSVIFLAAQTNLARVNKTTLEVNKRFLIKQSKANEETNNNTAPNNKQQHKSE